MVNIIRSRTINSVFTNIILYILCLTIGAVTSYARTEKVFIGSVAERYMDYLRTSTYSFIPDKYFKLPGEVGRSGIDGLYVQRRNGVISKVLIGESKYGKSNLGLTQHGKQMSQEWTEKKLDMLIKSTEKQLNNSVNWKEKQRLEQLLKDYKSVKRFIDHGSYRRQIYKTVFKDGRLHVKRYKVDDIDRKTYRMIRQQSGSELDKGIKLTDSEINKIKDPKKKRFHLREREKFFTQLKRELRKDGVENIETKRIVNKLRNGNISNGKHLMTERNKLANNVTKSRFQNKLAGHGRMLQSNKHFASQFRGLSGLKIFSYAAVVLEMKYVYDWTNNSISTRKFIKLTTIAAGTIQGAEIGGYAGELSGELAVSSINLFTDAKIDTEIGKNTGKFIGSAVGAYIGGKCASEMVDESYRKQDEKSREKYKEYLRELLKTRSM